MSGNETVKNDNSREGLFFQLFMAHQRAVYAYILASVHNYQDADDILQETATVMWRHFSEFRQGSSFIGWGIAIARIQVLKFFTNHKRSRIQFDEGLLAKLVDATLEETSRMEELKAAFRQCSNKLSDSNQKILEFRYKDGMTIKAIANLTGKPVSGMYKAFARLHNGLQRCIEAVLKQEQVL